MTPEIADSDNHAWPGYQQAAVRWLAVFLALSFPIHIRALFPYAGDVLDPIVRQYERPTIWFGETLLSFDSVANQPTGSGDRAFDWSLNVLLIALAVVGAVLWTVLARGRRSERAVLDLVHVTLRYGLGLTMFTYGIVKVLPSQFVQPQGDDLLLMTYGESSPMGLLWRYMGFSRTFLFFAGAVEVLGGVLLLFRRTWLAGALVTAAAMTQVVVSNFAFDVPVKIFSSQLLVAALVLILPFRHRLLTVLFTNRAIEPRVEQGLRLPHRLRRARPFIKGALLLACIGYTTNQAWDYYHQANFELAGVYQVDEASSTHTAANATVVSIGHFRNMTLWQTVGDRSTGLFFMVALNDNALTVSDFARPRGEFTVSRPSASTIVLDGELDGLATSFTLEARPPELTRRGFHWVSESPYTR